VSLAEIIAGLWGGILSLLFPSSCLLCGRAGETLCRSCLVKLPRLEGMPCPDCGLPGDGTLCPHCRKDKLPYSSALAAAPYAERWRELIHEFKYCNHPELAGPLGCYLAEFLEAYLSEAKIDLVTSVPLHAERLRERGYNQAELLAQSLCTVNGKLPYRRTLTRVKPSLPQHTLNRKERHANLRQAFNPLPAALQGGERVLLVDDVITTGATVHECSACLLKAGASAVYVAALARKL